MNVYCSVFLQSGTTKYFTPQDIPPPLCDWFFHLVSLDSHYILPKEIFSYPISRVGYFLDCSTSAVIVLLFFFLMCSLLDPLAAHPFVLLNYDFSFQFVGIRFGFLHNARGYFKVCCVLYIHILVVQC